MANGVAVDVFAAVAAGCVLLAAIVLSNYLRKRRLYMPRWRAIMRKGAINASVLALVALCCLLLVAMQMGVLEVVATVAASCMGGYAVNLAVSKAPIWKVLCAALSVADLLVAVVIPNGSTLYHSPYAVLLASVLILLALDARPSNRAEEVRAAFEEWRRQ